MKRMIIKPAGRRCRLGKCPPGHFVLDGNLCFKTGHYTTKGHMEVYNEAGEALWGGTNMESERVNLLVTPVKVELEDSE